MIARRVDADPGGTLQGVRQHFRDWLENGQDLLGEVSRLCSDLEQRRTEADAVSREAAGLRQEMASLRQENEALRSDNARLADEILQLRSHAASLEAEAATIRTQNAALMDERGETAKLIADKLEDMLAQVLPRLSRHGAAPADPGPRSRAAVLAALTAAVPAPPAPATPVPGPPPAPVPAAPVPSTTPAAAPPPNLTAATLVHVAPSEELEALMSSFEESEAPGAVPVLTLLDEPQPAETAPERARILIVDDEADFTELLRDHLGSSGYPVLTASNGDEALCTLEDFRPQVVLLDMMMAGVGGMETLRRIKAARPETLVIMITALDDRDVARKALAAGAADYLTKPLSLDFLDSALAVHAAGPLPAAAPPASDLVSAAAAPSVPRRTFFGRA